MSSDDVHFKMVSDCIEGMSVTDGGWGTCLTSVGVIGGIWGFSKILERFQNNDRHFIVDSPDLSEFKAIGRNGLTTDDAGVLFKEMKKVFASGHTLPVTKRKQALNNILRMFHEEKDAIVSALAKDLGKPELEALLYDVWIPIAELKHLLKDLDKFVKPVKQPGDWLSFPSSSYLIPEPLGVCLVIGTWNFPILLTLNPVIGAIAAGNAVILKPSNMAGACAKLLADLFPKYVDPRVLSVIGPAVQGDRGMTGALLEHPFDHVFFTGSPDVGAIVYEKAARHLTPCILELGGKNPVIVDSHCDVKMAAKRITWGRMLNAGQQCIAPDYCLVHRDVLEEFERECCASLEAAYGGPEDEKQRRQDMGRIVDDRAMNRLIKVLETHKGEVLKGGAFDKDLRYIEPTILKVGFDSPSLDVETFGPILLIVPVGSVRDAVDYVNSRAKPLSLYVFSKSNSTVDMVIRNTSSGGVTVNSTLFHAGHLKLPFGGVGKSGLGKYHGKYSFECFSHIKPVCVKGWSWPRGGQWNWDFGLVSEPFFLYPPWTSFKQFVFGNYVKYFV